MQEHKEIRVMVVGDTGCGKTCLLLSYATNRKPTLGCIPKLLDDGDDDLSTIPILVEGEEVDIKLVDSSEGGELDRIRLAKYESSHVVAVCFSVTNPSSLQNVTTKWLPEIRATAPHLPILLVGTKSDLRKKEEETLETYKYVGQQSVSEEQAKQVAKMVKASSFLECSAFTGSNIKAVFDELVKLSLQKKKKKNRKTDNNNGNSKGKRCLMM